MAPKLRTGQNKCQKARTSKEPKPGSSRQLDSPDQPKKKCKGQQVCKDTKAKDGHANPAMVPVLHINSLPNEILLQIFGNLTQNELGQISRVCRLWNNCVRSPVLWKEVDVKFSCKRIFRTESVLTFVEKLPSNVTHLKLDFGDDYKYRILNFEEFCEKLKEKFPNIHKLILCHTLLSVDLPSVINLCSDFLQNLKVLILPCSLFGNEQKKREHGHCPEIEILDISCCHNVKQWSMHSISEIHSLRKLNLSSVHVENNWFQYNMDISYLQQLEYLNLGWTNIDSTTFRILRNQCKNLTELFLCGTVLHDNDFNFNSTYFPLLKTICLRECFRLSCTGIVSLVKSCQSLENVYVDTDVAESYTKHPFIGHYPSKLAIVKVIDQYCDHRKELGYSLDK